MRKKILAVVLAAMLVMTCAVPVSSAELQTDGGSKAAEAMQVVTNSITDLKGVIPDDDTFSILSSIFDGVGTAGKAIGSFVGPVNGTVNFLKLVGLMKDGNSEKLVNILNQLRAINERLEEMDKKLDDLTTQMAAMQATAEFNTRTEKAMMLRDNWRTFRTNYMENTMDKQMSEYRAMLLNGLQKWCQNKTAETRTEGDIDNSKLILFYLPEEDGYQLALTTENGIPDDFPEDGRYLVLSEDFLPDNLTWNVNNYRDRITFYIGLRLKKLRDSGDFDAVESVNFPAFTAEGADELTDELIDRITEDAVDLLTYRVAAVEVNKDATFSLEVERMFGNYCSHLLSAEEGLDAVFKSIYLTHAFEYQVRDDINNFCNEMVLATATYGSFAMNVLGMSDFISDSDLEAAEENYYNTLLAIDKAKENGLTGNDRYCYVTNSEVCLTSIQIIGEGQINVKRDGASETYMNSYIQDGKLYFLGMPSDDQTLIGDTNAVLLSYLLQSSGETPTVANLKKKIGVYLVNTDNHVVTNMSDFQKLTFGWTVPFESFRCAGSYFPHYGTMYLNNLPGKATEGYFKESQMIRGSLCDLSTGSLEANRILSGFGIYGESHATWIHDEAAFVGGPTTGCEFQPNKLPVYTTSAQTPTGVVYYDAHIYDQHIFYNSLITVRPEGCKNTRSGYDPLASYRMMIANIKTGGFYDVAEEDWFCEAVRWASENEITKGTDATHFSPDLSCTRAQMVTFLWRAAGSPEPETQDMPFKDADINAYYGKALLWATEKGIVNGTSATTFSPAGTVTRGQTVAILHRYAKGEAEGENPFNDVKESDYFYDAVLWAVANNITTGTGGTTFSPNNPCTRAQIVTFLYRDQS